ncbi:MAG: hypothetical protein FK732_09475, partial [Asgard group archaeon]|nr:hypothetical protein [Asgard group archaeon]
MSEKKKSRGRPRIYKDDAEKQKAFRERKKEQFKKQEKKIKELEALVRKESDQQIDKKKSWFNWTFQDVKKSRTEQLLDCRRELKEILGEYSIHSPITILVDEVLRKATSSTKYLNQIIRNEVINSSRKFDETIFNLTVLQMINSELTQRTSEIDIDYEI